MSLKDDDMLGKYLRDIERFHLLTASQEKSLSKTIHNNKDKSEVRKARNAIIEGNLRMVVKLAIEFYNNVARMTDTNISLMDLIQAGNLGLMRAAEMFDYKRNFRFSGYAYPCIKRKMVKTVKESHFVRIPFNHFKHLAELNDLEGRYKSDTLTDEKIKKELNLSDVMFNMIKNERYAKTNIEEDEYGMENLENKDEVPLSRQIGNGQLKHYLYEKIKELEPSYRDVLFYKYFGGDEFTLRKIGKRIGVSGERVRQIIFIALKKLRKKIEEERAVENTKIKNK